MEKFPTASQRRVCRLLGVHRSTVWRQAQRSCVHSNPVVDEVLAERIKSIIEEFPTFGYRRVWAILRFRDKVLVNKKKMVRILSHQRLWNHSNLRAMYFSGSKSMPLS